MYSVKTVAKLSWIADDDATRLSTSQIYQIENAASKYFGELLNEWIEEDEDEQNYPLTTKVAVTDQSVGLTETGERLRFELPSILDFQYVGEDEIPSITATMQTLTDENTDSPAFSNLQTLVGANPPSSFTVIFSNTTMKASTLLYTVDEVVSSSNQVGLIVACIVASTALFLASVILLWAVGTFDGWNACKNLRARFYLPSSKAPESPIPYGMTKSTMEETVAGESNLGVGAFPLPTHDEEDEESLPHEQGIEMTPSRGIYQQSYDESDIISPSDSECTDISVDVSHVSSVAFSSVAPLGIASMRKEKLHARMTNPPTSSHCPMSPESILGDLQAFPIDVD